MFFLSLQPYSEPILHLLLPEDNQLQPVDVRTLLAPALAAPRQRNLICQHPTPMCGTVMLQSSLRAVHGEVLILNLARVDFNNVRLFHCCILLLRICHQ